MTDDVTSRTWFDAIAEVGSTIPGIVKVFAGGRGEGDNPKVVPMSNELAKGPVIIQAYGGAEVTPGSWEEQEHTLNCAIWIPTTAGTLGAAYSLAIEFIGRVMAVYPPRGQAYNRHPQLQSAIVTRFDRIVSQAWGDGAAQRQFVVLPYEIQAIVRRAAAYEPN